MKKCVKCGEVKDDTEFYFVSPSNPSRGRRSRCRACLSQRGRVYTPEEKAHRAAVSRAYRRANPERKRKTYLKSYGITPEEYTKLLEEQGGVCAICGGSPVDGDSAVKNFSVDHDHSCCDKPPLCGACVRGLLCRKCNKGLGHFNDSPELLRAAADYAEGRNTVDMECVNNSGYKVRLSRKWINEYGAPYCPCCNEQMEVSE